jgi:Rieske Fe-S protein
MTQPQDTKTSKCATCSRRAALKIGAGVALGLTSGATLPACGDVATLEQDVVIALSDYPQLMTEGEVVFLPNSVTGFSHPIIVINDGGMTFRAMSAECNHLGCDVELGSGQFDCPCHGSTFSLDGELLNGPATADLLAFDAESDGENLTISPRSE